MARYCGRCDERVGRGDRFCRTCGTALPLDRRGPWPVVLGSVAALVVVVAVATALVPLWRRHDETAARPATAAAPAPTTTTAPPSTTTSTTAQATTPELVAATRAGVVRIDAEGCGLSSTGTGFLVAPELVATAAHVVEGSTALALSSEGFRTEGVVVGYDPRLELALVRAEEPMPGPVLRFTSHRPAEGEPVVVLGHPLRGPLSVSEGIVSGLDREVVLNGHPLSGLIQTDAAVNPGNSGGPLLRRDGTVAGLVSAKFTEAENVSLAVSASTARGPITEWSAAPKLHPPVDCADPASATGASPVRADVGHPRVDEHVEALQRFVDGVNSRRYEDAYRQYSRPAREQVTLDQVRQGYRTSFLSEVRVREVTEVSAGVDDVRVTFTSTQAPEDGPDGHPCTRWDLTYPMRLEDGWWRLDRPRPTAGGPTPC